MNTKDITYQLRKGVQYERHGDMEPDIYSADYLMYQAADLIEELREENRKLLDMD